MTPPHDLAALQDLGFTEIEALVYAALLTEAPTTGYRLSHRIGRPTPNTYKAIAALQAKGAVLVDDGHSRLCRPVPPDEVLAALERQFRERKTRALAAMEALRPDDADDRVYRVESVRQVLERARAMLATARRLVLLDLFPGPFAALAEALVAAARRVRVVAKVYAPVRAPGVTLVPCPDPERVRAVWPGQQLSLVRDAEEHLVALLAEDLGSVHQAVWSNSTFLSCMHHNHLASELLLTDQGQGAAPVAARASAATAGAARRGPRLRPDTIQLTSSGVSGLRTLRQRFGHRPATQKVSS